MKNNLLITIIVVLLVGAVSFYAGMKYQQTRSPRNLAFQGNFNNRNGQFQQRGNQQGFRPVSGEIISADDKSVTVKLDDGSSKIIILSENTTINKSTEGSKADLKTGEKIIVMGVQNSDGSLTAQNIQLGTNFRRINVSGNNGQ